MNNRKYTSYDPLSWLLIIGNIICFSVVLSQSDIGLPTELPIDQFQESFFDQLTGGFFAQGTQTQSYDLSTIFANINAQINPIKNFIIAISYAVGLGLCIIAVMKLKKYGTKTAYMHVESSLVGPFLQFFIGIALFYLPTFIQSVNQTLWQSPKVADSLLGYSTSADSESFEQYIAPILGVIQIIGMISFIRGWVMLSKATNVGQQPGAVSKGLTHVLGGVCAINIYTVIEVFNQTFLMTPTTS